MAKGTSTNYTATTAFMWPTSSSDTFAWDTDIEDLAIAVEGHDHSAGRGVPVTRIQGAVLSGSPSAAGYVLRATSSSAATWAILASTDLSDTTTVALRTLLVNPLSVNNGSAVATFSIAEATSPWVSMQSPATYQFRAPCDFSKVTHAWLQMTNHAGGTATPIVACAVSVVTPPSAITTAAVSTNVTGSATTTLVLCELDIKAALGSMAKGQAVSMLVTLASWQFLGLTLEYSAQ